MKKTGKHIMTGKHVGKKLESQEKPLKSYSIYSSCYTCPLSVYIELICDGNWGALVISGNPSEDLIKGTADKLIAEFAQMCNSGLFSQTNNKLREVYLNRAQLIGYSICSRLIALGDVEYAVEYLGKLGLRCQIPKTNEEFVNLGEKISGKIKEKNIRMRKTQRELETLRDSHLGEKPTKQYFTDQLIEISKWMGYRVTPEITLAEYASYLNKMKEYAESLQLKMKKHG